MKFPCHNCHKIRTFSGEPPKCDFCGWARDRASRSEGAQGVEPPAVWTGEEKVARGSLLRVGLLGIVIAGMAYWAVQVLGSKKNPNMLSETKYGIALKYNLTEDQVFMDPKPTDCDFAAAPVGDKRCHFEESLNVVRECVSLTGSPAAPEENCPVKRVYVSWRKVRD